MQTIHNPIRGISAALALFLVAASTASALAAGTVTVVNGTRTAMITLQLKDTNGFGWQGDVLGGKPLGVQRRITVPYVKACICDIRATFEDGHRVMRRHVNVCSTPTYVVQDL